MFYPAFYRMFYGQSLESKIASKALTSLGGHSIVSVKIQLLSNFSDLSEKKVLLLKVAKTGTHYDMDHRPTADLPAQSVPSPTLYE